MVAIDKMKLGNLLPAQQIREKSFEIYGLENAIKTYVGIYTMCTHKIANKDIETL